MKIYAILDHRVANKTFLPVVPFLEKLGHEVYFDMYYDVERIKWCDAVWGEYLQGGVIEAFNDETMKKPLFVRGIDIDLWYGHFMGVDLNKAKGVFFINDYMRKWAVGKYESARYPITTNIETIPLGIDTDRFNYSDKSVNHGKTIGWLNEFWLGKGINLMCQLIYKLTKIDKDYKFKLVGNKIEDWLEQYFNEFVKRNNLQDKVDRQQEIVDINKWYEGIDYIVSTSMKECMSLPMAEAMSKGIKPVIHHWWDASALYPKHLVWEGIDEAIDIIMEDKYESAAYRQYIIDNYSMEEQVSKIDKWLKTI